MIRADELFRYDFDLVRLSISMRGTPSTCLTPPLARILLTFANLADRSSNHRIMTARAL
jgi:hypothetical protein